MQIIAAKAGLEDLVVLGPGKGPALESWSLWRRVEAELQKKKKIEKNRGLGYFWGSVFLLKM